MRNFSTRLIQLSEQNPSKQILHVLETGEGNKHLNYHELLDGGRKYTSFLSSKGIKPGEVNILVLPHGIDLIYAYFGAVLNGSIPSIMPFLTEKLHPEKYHKDLISLISITQPSAVITSREFSPEMEKIKLENDFIKAILYVDDVNSLENEFEGKLEGLNRNPEEIALLQHSSGTTGLQKGVALSHQAVFNQLDSYRDTLHISQDDVIVSWLPLYHDMGLIACFLMPILYNIPLVIMSPFDWVRAPYRLFQAISRYKGTLCWLPNFAYNFCTQKIRPEDLEEVNLKSLRAVINCSEPMRYASHQMFLSRFADYGLRDSAIATSYAMAENVFAVSQDGIDEPVVYDEIERDTFQKEKIAKKSEKGIVASINMVSAGKPIKNTRVKIVDEKGNSLPERHLGEILIKSNCMLSEYYRRPDATERAFIDGWFRTGDLGYMADGKLYIGGRKKDLIIVGGKNIYPQDIESIVNEVEGVHPGRSVAFGIFNDKKGTEEIVVIAELEKGYDDQAKEISDQIRRNVTQSTAISLRTVHLVNSFWLIKTSSGKIARAANKKKYIEEINR